MAVGDVIIVDDQAFSLADPNQWATSGIHREFHSTNIVATQAGASWSYEFIGTAVEVLGTIPTAMASVTVTFSIDGVKIQDYNSPANFPQDTRHQTFFRSIDHLNLDPTVKHKLQVTQQTLPSAGRFLFFDYLLYTASNSTQIDQATTRAFIDEREAKYAGSGSPGQVVSAEAYFRGSVTKLSQPDQILTLPFNGTQIEIYGCTSDSTPSNTTSASFSINRKVKQTIMTSVNAEEQMNALLYTSEELDSKSQHTLTVNWESGPPLCVDYFLVTPVSNASVSPSSTPTTAAKTLAPAAIGGIAAGGFALLLLVLLGVFLLRKRRRTQKRKPDDFEIESYPASGGVPMGSTYGQASSPSIQPTTQHTTRPSVSDASAIGAAFYLPSESGHSLAYLADHGNSSSHQLLAPEPPSYSSVPPMPVSRTGKGGT